MLLLVTSASGANGNGALLAFDYDGKPLGAFSEDNRVVDPRGLAAEERKAALQSRIGRRPAEIGASRAKNVTGR